MTEKSITIIGAGIARSSAGFYGQMNGYRTRIFERHTIPVGCAPPGNVSGTLSMGAFAGWLAPLPPAGKNWNRANLCAARRWRTGPTLRWGPLQARPPKCSPTWPGNWSWTQG